MQKVLLPLLFLACCLLFCSPALAQWTKGISIEPSLHVGRIYKHSPFLVFKVPRNSYGFDLNLTNKKYGKKEWHQYLGYPTAGINLFFYQIGEKDTFGSAIGILPTFRVPIFKIKKVDFQFQVGAGIAWLTQHYDPLDNVMNNAIGSNLNNITSFKFDFGYRLNPRWKIKTGFSFTHFSNGASQLPNYGINIPAGSLGLQYTPKPLVPEDFIRHPKSEENIRQLGMAAHYGFAYREIGAFNGPRYPIKIVSLAGIYKINPAHHFYFGTDYEYNEAVFQFGLHTYFFSDKEEARKRSRRLALFIGHELLFGNVGFYGQVGYYLPTDAYLLLSNVYTKLSLRYYLPEVLVKDFRPFLAIHLKAHNTVAEYLSFGVGVKW